MSPGRVTQKILQRAAPRPAEAQSLPTRHAPELADFGVQAYFGTRANLASGRNLWLRL